MEKLIGKAAACAEGGFLEPFILLEPPAHNPACNCVIGLIYNSGISYLSCQNSAGPPLRNPLDLLLETRETSAPSWIL